MIRECPTKLCRAGSGAESGVERVGAGQAGIGEDMPGVRKVAVLLMSLDTDRAAKLIRELDPDDVAAVAVELEQMQHLGGTTIDTVIEDFARTAAEQRRDVRGGSDYVRRLLEISLGADGAAEVYDQLGGRERFGFLATFDIPTLVTMLSDEHPQTIAVVLAHLAPDRAARLRHRDRPRLLRRDHQAHARDLRPGCRSRY